MLPSFFSSKRSHSRQVARVWATSRAQSVDALRALPTGWRSWTSRGSRSREEDLPTGSGPAPPRASASGPSPAALRTHLPELVRSPGSSPGAGRLSKGRADAPAHGQQSSRTSRQRMVSPGRARPPNRSAGCGPMLHGRRRPCQRAAAATPAARIERPARPSAARWTTPHARSLAASGVGSSPASGRTRRDPLVADTPTGGMAARHAPMFPRSASVGALFSKLVPVFALLRPARSLALLDRSDLERHRSPAAEYSFSYPSFPAEGHPLRESGIATRRPGGHRDRTVACADARCATQPRGGDPQSVGAPRSRGSRPGGTGPRPGEGRSGPASVRARRSRVGNPPAPRL